jgi:hypothetical protein
MTQEIPTAEEILYTITAARDSVWVIETEVQNQNPTKDTVRTVERNVSHLELVTSKQHIIDSGEDISDLISAIQLGNTFVQQNAQLLQD